MRKKITIGTKNVEMAASAATPFWFKQIFNEDFFVVAERFRQSDTSGESIDIYSRLAFLMAMQGKKKDMKELTIDDYVSWLEGFAPLDIALAVDEIAELYTSQTKPSSEPKK